MSKNKCEQTTAEEDKIITNISILNNQSHFSSFNDQSKEEMTEYLIYNKLIYSKESLLFQTKFSNKIIEIYFNELEMKREIKIRNKLRIRKYSYITKLMAKNKEIKTKLSNKIEYQKVISQFFISFNKNISIFLSKYKKEKTKGNNLKIINLNNFFQIILKAIEFSYISGLINDDFFELIIKNTLNFSLESENDVDENYQKELKYMMFFNGIIQLIKSTFNKIYLPTKKFSERQKEIIKNIIIHINNNILNFSKKYNFNIYSNKCFLYKNDYKTTLLIELAYIIIKMKSSEISNYFLNLLTNIHYFSFNYENSMKPMLKLIEPLFFHLNNKNLDEIYNELELVDFTLNYLNALNNKEKTTLRENPCMIKQGFYLGNKLSGIYGDIYNNFENDFVIFFGFRLESDLLNDILIFQLYNEEKNQIKIFLRKNLQNNYELYALDGDKEKSTKIIIYPKKNYILSFLFVTEGFWRNRTLKIMYVKDEIIERKGQEINIISGADIKLKNIDNIKKFCIGCERSKFNKDLFENKFIGFIGHFIILNAKHIKENLDAKIYENILKLKQNYYYIINILLDENSIFKDTSFNLEYNSTFNNYKKFYEELKVKTELKSNHIINTIISPKYFRLIDYQDDIDYMNSINNYEYFSSEKEIHSSIKFKYLNYKMKSEQNNTKNITINSSIFNKQFHIFERKYSIIEFVKYEGIHYLSLLFEYYYQIICYLIEIKDEIEENIFKAIFKKINEKILKLMDFFSVNIIQTNLCEYNLIEVEQFFYQMTKTLFKFVEIEELEFETFKCIIDIINVLENNWNIDKSEIFYYITLMKRHLIEFLINPRIYDIKSNSCLEKLNYVLFYLLTYLFKVEIKFFYEIFSVENLEMLMSFTWLLDEPKSQEFFEETKKNYISLLVLFIQMSTCLSMAGITNEEEEENPEEEEKSQKILQIFARESETSERDNNNLLISDFFQMILHYTKNQHIIFNLTLILVRTNLISLLKEADIENAKFFFLNEIKDYEFVNTDYKKTLYLSYLQILIPYYFSDKKYKSQNVTVNNFHEFIYTLNLDIDLFYALIALIRYVNNFSQINEVDITSYKSEELKTISKNDYPVFSDLPLREVNIEKLNEIEIYIIRNILLDIVYLLDKFEKSFVKNYKFNSQNEGSTMGKEFFEIIKKNVDIVFKFPNTRLYETMFSSESNICTKLFMIKLENGLEKDINYLKNVLKKYYKEVVKNYYCPFIFKFILEMSEKNTLIYDPDIENRDIIISEFKSDMITFIISTLNDFSKEVETSKDKMSFYIFNLLNCLIVINEELNYKINKLSKKKNFYESLYVLFSLISEGLLYSNFSFEFKDKRGKIISEIILDIFLSIPSEHFRQKIFVNTFIKSKEKMTIFYIMDNYRKKLKERKKIKSDINFPELDKLKEIHNIFLSINPKRRKMFLVEENTNFQIEDVNFTTFFLAKCFVYLRASFLKEKENQIKVKTLTLMIPCIIDDLYSLYTKNKKFYSTRRCGFPIYDETKKYFESYLIPSYNYMSSKNFELLKKFFENDLLVTIKDEYDLDYCYSSRLYKTKRNEENEIKENDLNDENNDDSKQKNTNIIEKEIELNQSDTSTLYMFFPDKDLNSNTISNNLEISFDNIVVIKKANEIKESAELNIKEFPNTFEIFNEHLILNPKNFFLNNIFSEVYKDIIFYNKLFINIKKIYFIKFRKENDINIESKQKNYPTSQKNYSNFLEPKIFLKRDFNFYDEVYFPVSFPYLPETFNKRKMEDLFFYKHRFKYDKRYKKMMMKCELVTSQYLYFGKLFFFEKYIIFESEKDPRDDSKNEFDIDIFINYSISTKTKDIYPSKYKFVVITLKNIKEVIKRRTLLLTQSIEIYLKNGKSFFFNFYMTQKAEKIYEWFNKAKNKYEFIFNMSNNNKEIKNILSQYHNGKISNYDYLLYLNKFATRTYCDLTQYPVFPWILIEPENVKNIDKIDELSDYLRDMKYPISVQSDENRAKCSDEYRKELENLEESEENEERDFVSHFQVHYSTSAFIYYYLMRLNPYGRDLIKLQNYQNENPNRVFSSLQSLKAILTSGVDNRELIPDFFCYFDFLINLNCNFFGKQITNILNDDYILNSRKLSEYVYNLYLNKKILNSVLISNKLHDWVDNIFGKNQLPEDETSNEAIESCNIFQKYSYEQRTNFEKELNMNEKILRDKNITKTELVKKMREIKTHLGFASNFGITPKQILTSSNIYEGENKTNANEIRKNFEDKIIYYEKLSNDEYIFLKDIKKKDKNKIKSVSLFTYKNKSLNESKIYECKQLNLMKKYKYFLVEVGKKKNKIPLYDLSYSISYIEHKSLKKNKWSNITILSCRYLGNYFNIQNIEKNINIFCEDFVTCIKSNSNEFFDNFYTGLINGKLIEWEITSNLDVKEIKHIYSHSSSITAIEIYNRQNIIITAGEDKFIHIRKRFDFELLTAINLNYCFGNPTISQNFNIFPSLIKISDLNLLYVLLFDLDSETNFIRGYNLNGLLFAQTGKTLIKEEKNKKCIINSISFTKNSNLIIGFHNLNNYILLQSWDLNIKRKFDINDKNDREGTKMIIYDPILDMINILYDNEFIREYLDEENEITDY